ncbi:MAG TPA: hypothetical protein VLF62_01910 [Candidatus Saccharimonadales bacterium]|nr:hypothetical protein [Candidatus Saccharimonadales bacterium]
MGIISTIFYFFTPYTDSREQAVGLFFKGLNERRRTARTRTKLGRLLQRNIAVINLWTEYQYKGYKYLNKSERRKLYANLELIAEDFGRFYANNAWPAETILARASRIAPGQAADAEKIVLLQALMDYFSPLRGKYVYRESSSFGRLLRNPAHEKLVGDCNQIVTLYIYLYSRYYSVDDLQLRSVPGHVALHYAGIDIEATNGTFINYSGREGSKLLPIEEIVSINLLDTTDSYLATHEVAPKAFLQASRLAFILSHNRTVATQNLAAAYNRLVNTCMERGDYSQALKYALASRSQELLGIVGHNGAVHEMERHNYAAARRYAQHALDKDALTRASWQAEGSHYFDAHNYHSAIKAFKHSGDKALVGQGYEGLLLQEQKKLGKNPTTDSIKQHARTIHRMHAYAKKSGNKKLVAYTSDLKRHL